MPISSILVASDRSPNGRHAVRAAACLAATTGANLIVVAVVRLGGDGAVPLGRLASTRDRSGPTDQLLEFAAWVGPLDPPIAADRLEIAVAFGVTGIEICRLADQRNADLIVLGRSPRSIEHPLILGETADALVRRSSRPVLFVPPSVARIRSVLVALDGTERTAGLLGLSRPLAESCGASMAAVTVQPAGSGQDQLDAAGHRLRQILGRTEGHPEGFSLTVRSGNPIDEVLQHVETNRPDLLVIGYRRGGPPKVIGPADIARNLLYSASSAVLTIPR